MTTARLADRLRALIRADSTVISALEAIRDLRLPDAWLGGSCVRGAVWDNLHAFGGRTPLRDADVLYFDAVRSDKSIEAAHASALEARVPQLHFSVKNQARMHIVNGDKPYASTLDALTKVPDTVSAVAVALGNDGNIDILAPFGLEDLFAMEVRPTPYGKEHMDRYTSRVRSKDWNRQWPRVRIH